MIFNALNIILPTFRQYDGLAYPIRLLIKVLSGLTPEEILSAELKFIDAIGLRQHIAVTRANGLASMIKQMKAYALAHKEG